MSTFLLSLLLPPSLQVVSLSLCLCLSLSLSLSFSLSLSLTHIHTHTCTHTHMHTHSHLHLMLAEEKYSREVVVIPVDFSDGLEIYPNIAEQLKNLDIGVLSKLVGRK